MPEIIYNGITYTVSDTDADDIRALTDTVKNGTVPAVWLPIDQGDVRHNLWFGPGVALTVIGAR